MKLILCRECTDIIRLINRTRHCRCRKCSGKYIDNINAVYSGENAVPLGFANNTLVEAILNQPEDGMGELFTAFVIPKECDTFKKVKNKKKG